MSNAIRGFVKSLFLWTIAGMPRVRTVAVLGKEAWRELTTAIEQQSEIGNWKARHESGLPLITSVGSKTIAFVALNHPARISASELAKQPGWRWVVKEHSGAELLGGSR